MKTKTNLSLCVITKSKFIDKIELESARRVDKRKPKYTMSNVTERLWQMVIDGKVKI